MSWDSWKTYVDVPMRWESSPSPARDIFSCHILVPSSHHLTPPQPPSSQRVDKANTAFDLHHPPAATSPHHFPESLHSLRFALHVRDPRINAHHWCNNGGTDHVFTFYKLGRDFATASAVQAPGMARDGSDGQQEGIGDDAAGR
ncbi:hypothetical protein M427DRAFT_32382 [Gonapodya prolifera JEL478]|uniref:Uncharacterized protein n=1 Tax=Gonapodya prolifera (strain JEL478) TaxID=1344416 RepID=A0A139AF94_GONPJ|nr:hypothetical protein M427DRAFT_32382 [Gonapodya prolifera JEL478]|eukprot:KXS15428.1 hypothetical protein M427DRAFT_32382 [Gonapodya prolifera JEL478]